MPLFLGLHGGGGCPASVNDQQWKNQQQLYHQTFQALANSTGESLLYVAPRAPTNTWNLWHEAHMDLLLDRLIENLLLLPPLGKDNDKDRQGNHKEDTVRLPRIDSNRIYIMGYSAGGDGIYMLAPRMADRWAAASMMAGHPNGVSLRGIYNLPFSLHVGANDSAYQRHTVGRQYKNTLEKWQQQEAAQEEHRRRIVNNNSNIHTSSHSAVGYQHIWAKIYEGKGHGLGGKDAAAIPWMAQYRRRTCPPKLVWDKHSSRHGRFYWIQRSHKKGQQLQGEMQVSLEGQEVVIDVTKCQNPEVLDRLTLRFQEGMIDMEQPVTIYRMSRTADAATQKRQLLQTVQLARTIGVLSETLEERGDPNAVFCAQVNVDLSLSSSTTEEQDGTTVDGSINDDPKPPKRLRGSQSTS